MTGNTLGGVMRQFIRHPVSIPIEVRAGERADGGLHHTLNLSLGGLEIDSDSAIRPDGGLSTVCVSVHVPACRSSALAGRLCACPAAWGKGWGALGGRVWSPARFVW